MKQAVFFSTTIRILLESQIELTLSSTMNLYTLTFETRGDKFSYFLTMMIAALMYSAPLMIFVFLYRRQQRVNRRIFKARFGSLYEGLRVDCLMSILSNFFFTLRRLFLIIITVFFTEHPAFQVMAYIFCSQLNLMYLIHYKPYETPQANKSEIFNEACVLAAGYHLFIFTDFVDSLQIKETGGNGIVAVILSNFGINLALQLY